MILICADRDGTINIDENYFLGSHTEWKKQVAFMPGVVQGIKLLNTIKDCNIYIVTNQAGVAIADEHLKHLDEERMHEVNKHLIEQLSTQGATIHDYIACPYIGRKYLERKKGKHTYHQQYVVEDHPHIKPNKGMIDSLIEENHLNNIEIIYMIGDRKSDVELGLNAKGKSILVESSKTKELGDTEAVAKLSKQHPGQVMITKNFYEAAQWIKKDVEEIRTNPSS